MIETNLLPDNLKEELKKRSKARRIIIMLIFFVLCTGIFSLVIMNFEQVTSSELEMLKNQITNAKLLPANTELIRKQKELDKLKSLTTNLAKVQADQQYVTPFLSSVLNSVPEGVKMEDVAMDFLENKTTLRGNASSRDTLLSLIDNLKKNPTVSRVDNPLSNLVSQTNINFEIEIINNPSEIKRLSNEKADQ